MLLVGGLIINTILEAAIYCCKCGVGLLANQVYEYASKTPTVCHGDTHI